MKIIKSLFCSHDYRFTGEVKVKQGKFPETVYVMKCNKCGKVMETRTEPKNKY